MSLRLERCPVCRARLSGDEPLAEPCRRCGADLKWVRAAERQAEHALLQAQRARSLGDAALAQRWAHRAVALVDHPETRAALALQ